MSVQPPESSGSECEHDDNDPFLTAVGTSKVAVNSAKPKLGGRKNPRSKGHTSRKQGANSYQHLVPSIEQTDPTGDPGRSPSTDVSGPFPVSQSGSTSSYQGGNLASEPSLTPDILSYSHLSWDQEFYLDYHRRNLTYHHYFFKHEANDFIHQILIERALSYEPLLFAVVGFAAFQATLKKDNGKIQEFLGYYNRSVSLLRKSLAGGQAHTDATMLTILQLATIEVQMNSLRNDLCLLIVYRSILVTGSIC